jgi:hypothetical protein
MVDLPLIVLSASRFPPNQPEPEGFFDALHVMHAETATLSSRGSHRVIAGADHYSLVMHPEGSQATSEAVRQLLVAVR